MKDALSRRQLLAAGGTAAVAGLSGCITTDRDVTATVTESYPVDALDAIEVENTNGDVTVRGEDRDDVALTGAKAAIGQDGLDSIEVVDSRTGGTLELRVDGAADGFVIRLGPGPKMDLELAVPTDLRVARVETVNGAVRAENVRGDLFAETTNGGVRLSRVRGSVTAETTNGGIEAVGIDGDVTAETTNGDVTARDVTGRVTADTTNGDVRTQNVTGPVSQR